MTIISSLCCCLPPMLCENCGDCPEQATVNINVAMVVQFGSSVCECDVTILDSITLDRTLQGTFNCGHGFATDQFANATHSCEDQVPADPVLLVRLECLASPWEDFPCHGGFHQHGHRVSLTYGFTATPQAYFFHNDPDSHCAQGQYTLAVCPPESGSQQGPNGHLFCSHLTIGTVFVN